MPIVPQRLFVSSKKCAPASWHAISQVCAAFMILPSRHMEARRNRSGNLRLQFSSDSLRPLSTRACIDQSSKPVLPRAIKHAHHIHDNDLRAIWSASKRQHDSEIPHKTQTLALPSLSPQRSIRSDSVRQPNTIARHWPTEIGPHSEAAARKSIQTSTWPSTTKSAVVAPARKTESRDNPQ